MRIIASSTLDAYATAHPSTASSLRHWRQVVRLAKWSSANDVQAAFSQAKVLNGERVRFEVAGGSHRMIVAFDFGRQIAFIKFVGSHAEYDRIDALTVALF